MEFSTLLRKNIYTNARKLFFRIQFPFRGLVQNLKTAFVANFLNKKRIKNKICPRNAYQPLKTYPYSLG